MQDGPIPKATATRENCKVGVGIVSAVGTIKYRKGRVIKKKASYPHLVDRRPCLNELQKEYYVKIQLVGLD